MTIFGRVVRWLRGRPVWAGNRYDPGDTVLLYFIVWCYGTAGTSVIPHFCITMDGEISDIVNIVLYTKRSVRRILVVVSRRILALLNDSC